MIVCAMLIQSRMLRYIISKFKYILAQGGKLLTKSYLSPAVTKRALGQSGWLDGPLRSWSYDD